MPSSANSPSPQGTNPGRKSAENGDAQLHGFHPAHNSSEENNLQQVRADLAAELDLDDDIDPATDLSGSEPDMDTFGHLNGSETPPFENFPQPDSLNGVTGDMATLALDRTLLHGDGNQTSTAYAAWAQMTDAEIMLRVREGDDTGFDFLIAKYRQPIVRFMYRMVHNQAVAEELAQEVFLRVYRSRQTYRAEARFSTWLYRIATNLGVNHARDTKYERAASNIYLDEPDTDTGTTPDVADSTPGAEETILRRERLHAIRQHVMALPERQRTAVLMHKYQEMDYKQIGEVLKLSESATKSLLFRAYQTLRERLKDFV
ncbi:MAG: RNA polymerase sigma factor [Acidobacteriaceae bacterium]